MQPSTEVQRRLEGATGYAFSVDQQTNSKGQRFTARPGGLPRLHGFSIEVLVVWRTLSSRFIPDTFAADLLQSMSDAPPDKLETFSRMARTLGESGLQVALKTDELDCDPAATEGWPDTWKTVDIRVETGPHDISEQAMA